MKSARPTGLANMEYAAEPVAYENSRSKLVQGIMSSVIMLQIILALVIIAMGVIALTHCRDTEHASFAPVSGSAYLL